MKKVETKIAKNGSKLYYADGKRVSRDKALEAAADNRDSLFTIEYTNKTYIYWVGAVNKAPYSVSTDEKVVKTLSVRIDTYHGYSVRVGDYGGTEIHKFYNKEDAKTLVNKIEDAYINGEHGVKIDESGKVTILTAEVDVEDYAVSTAAQEVAIEAEIELASKSEVEGKNVSGTKRANSKKRANELKAAASNRKNAFAIEYEVMNYNAMILPEDKHYAVITYREVVKELNLNLCKPWGWNVALMADETTQRYIFDSCTGKEDAKRLIDEIETAFINGADGVKIDESGKVTIITTEANVDEYAVSTAAQEVAVEAEIANANNVTSIKEESIAVDAKKEMKVSNNHENFKMTTVTTRISANGNLLVKVEKAWEISRKFKDAVATIRNTSINGNKVKINVEIATDISGEWKVASVSYIGGFDASRSEYIFTDENGTEYIFTDIALALKQLANEVLGEAVTVKFVAAEKPAASSDTKGKGQQELFAGLPIERPKAQTLVIEMYGDKRPMFAVRRIVDSGRVAYANSLTSKKIDEIIWEVYTRPEIYANTTIEIPEVVAVLDYVKIFNSRPHLLKDLKVILTGTKDNDGERQINDYAKEYSASAEAIDAFVESYSAEESAEEKVTEKKVELGNSEADSVEEAIKTLDSWKSSYKIMRWIKNIYSDFVDTYCSDFSPVGFADKAELERLDEKIAAWLDKATDKFDAAEEKAITLKETFNSNATFMNRFNEIAGFIGVSEGIIIEQEPKPAAQKDAAIKAEIKLADSTDEKLSDLRDKVSSAKKILKEKRDALEKAKRELERAEKEVRQAEEQARKANSELDNFGIETAKKLRKELVTEEIASATKITVVNQAEIAFVPAFDQIWIGYREKSKRFVIADNARYFGVYDTAAQVESVIKEFKAAIKRGDKEFIFPDIFDESEEVKPPTSPEKPQEVIETDKKEINDSLFRAMEIALKKIQEFCQAKNITAAINEMKLYNICSNALPNAIKPR